MNMFFPVGLGILLAPALDLLPKENELGIISIGPITYGNTL
jgi:hypothetical protein